MTESEDPQKIPEKSPERIINQVIEDEMKASYLDYSMSVIVGRALPDIRDGLKPVHRRILFAMNDMGIRHNTPYKKCARIVGECFVKGTLITTPKGIMPIENIKKGDFVYTHKGKQKVTELYIMPKKKLLKLTLENGLENTVTKGQKFKIFTKDLKFVWKEVSKIKPGEFIALKQEFPIKINSNKINKNEAYLLGFFLSDGWLEKATNRIGFFSTSKKTILKLQKIIKKEYNYKTNVLIKEKEDFKKGYYIRISKSSISNKFIKKFSLENADAYTKKIPAEILDSPKETLFALLGGLIDGDGSIHKNRNVIHYGSISKDMINTLQTLLFYLGFNSTKYTTYSQEQKLKNRIIKSNYPFYSLEITGVNAQNLSKHLIKYMGVQEKIINLKKISSNNLKKNKEDNIPFAASHIFSEFTKKHVGGGWYKDLNGKKFRLGIKYPNGTKIRYSKQIKDKKLGREQIIKLNILSKLNKIGSPLSKKFEDIINNKIKFVQVKKITESIPLETYDIQVENEHEFIANGMLSHNCLGKYHPHGDTAVYDSLVRMAQLFSLRYPLVQGQGNFGSQDGDSPAAMRYTEARLAKISQEMLQDIDKETVKFTDNFDGSLQEPSVLPSKMPNLLLNGSTGIAVGMATNIPPHNLKEVCSGVIRLIDDPTITPLELMENIKGPDFPTGGLLVGKAGIMSAYTTGRGKVLIRSKMKEEEHKGRQRIIVTEIPYMINKSDLVIQIAGCVKDKKIEGISDLRDESDRKGLRIVIELKKDANVELIKNQLYSHTRLQDTFGIILLSLVNNQPKILNLKEILSEYVKHRQVIVRKRTEYNLKKAEGRAHIIDGLIIALDDIDNAIALIKQSKSAAKAKENLMNKYSLDEIQSQAILDMKLQKLAQLEADKIREEYHELKIKIEGFNELLADEQKILNIIKQEQQEMIDTYGDDRRSEILDVEDESIDMEDLIPQHETVVTISNAGYIKRIPLVTYKIQKRGGKGVIGAESKEEDFIESLFVANTHSYLLIFTDKGKVHWLKVYRIPEASRYSKGKAIINLIEIEKGDKISTVIPIKKFDDSHFLVIATKKGIIKKTELSAYSKPRRGGIRAITLDEKDDIVSVTQTDGKQQILLATKNGLASKFNEKDARSIGRTGKGVIGIRLKGNDEVVGMLLVDDDTNIMTLTTKGYGKQTKASEYRLINRGGKGVRNINLTEKNGKVVSVKAISGKEELMLITKRGMVIRTRADQINVIGRNTQGVRVIRLNVPDELMSAAKVLSEEEEVEQEEQEIKESEKNPEEKHALNVEKDDKKDLTEEETEKNSDDSDDTEESKKESDFDRIQKIDKMIRK